MSPGHTAALEEAIAAANAWAEDTGMGAADSLLALCLSPAPVPDLRHAALRVLHASSLRKCLVGPPAAPLLCHAPRGSSIAPPKC